MYNFKMTEEQELLLESIDQFIEQCKAKGLDEDYLRRCDEAGEYPAEFIKELNDAGFGTLAVPTEFGGGGVDNVTLVLVTERFTRHGYPSNTLNALVADDLIMFGSPEQVQMAVDQLQSGDPNGGFAIAITEPGAGSDNSAMATLFVENEDGTVTINGSKSFISNAENCGYFLVVGKDADPVSPKFAFSMYMVPAHAEGVTYSTMHKIGAKLLGKMSEVTFTNVVVPKSALVGKKGMGFIQLMQNFEMERLVLCAGALGQAEHAMDIAGAYANQRIAFGKTIGSFQLIQQKLVENTIAIENMRRMLLEAAWKKDQGQSIRVEASLAKYYCAKEGFRVIDECMQIMGGVGYIDDCAISREWRDARMNRIGGGTDEIMIHATGREILKRYAAK